MIHGKALLVTISAKIIRYVTKQIMSRVPPEILQHIGQYASDEALERMQRTSRGTRDLLSFEKSKRDTSAVRRGMPTRREFGFTVALRELITVVTSRTVPDISPILHFLHHELPAELDERRKFMSDAQFLNEVFDALSRVSVMEPHAAGESYFAELADAIWKISRESLEAHAYRIGQMANSALRLIKHGTSKLNEIDARSLWRAEYPSPATTQMKRMWWPRYLDLVNYYKHLSLRDERRKMHARLARLENGDEPNSDETNSDDDEEL